MPKDHQQTVLKLAARLEVGDAMVRQWIRSGELRAIDIGKGWPNPDTDLQYFLTSHETTPSRDTAADLKT